MCEHVLTYYKDLFTKEDWDRPSLDNLGFSLINEADADRIEKGFDEEEIKAAVFYLERDKAPSPDGYPIAFFQTF